RPWPPRWTAASVLRGRGCSPAALAGELYRLGQRVRDRPAGGAQPVDVGEPTGVQHAGGADRRGGLGVVDRVADQHAVAAGDAERVEVLDQVRRLRSAAD